MTSAQSVHFLVEVFSGKAQELITEITDVHMVWLEEIQQEANRMFSRDFVNVLELMPKTPSQKRNTRKKRVSLGRQEEGQARRRLSRGKRSNLRKSCVKSLNLIPEEEPIPEASASKAGNATRPKRATRKNRQTKAEDEGLSSSDSVKQKEEDEKPSLAEGVDEVDQSKTGNDAGIKSDDTARTSPSPPKTLSPKLVVSISAEERLSAELAKKPEASAGSAATDVAMDKAVRRSRRSSVRCSLKLRHSLAGLRHSMTQEAVRRASRRSMLKRMSIRMGSSTSSSSSNVGGAESSIDSTAVDGGEVKTDALTADVMDHVPGEATEAIDDDPELAKETVDIVPEASEPQANFKVPVSTERVTRSVAANSPKLSPPPLFFSEIKTTVPVQKSVGADKKQMKVVRRTSLSTKRKAPDTVEDSPSKRFSPPKKSQSAVKPNMRSFLHTVNKNQMLMMTPTSLGRTAVVKSFIKHGTPLRIDPKTKERYKLEALRKKQEQEEERMKKMEEEKKKKQEELRRKREERIRRVFEAKVKEEQREEEKKKKIEQKMAHIEKNDKRQAEEKAKKRVVAGKRQEELEQKKKLEEEAARKKKIQQEEEKREQELAAKRKAEEEEEQARKELELKKEQERERERKLERERQAAAERERVEKEKALALRRELERAAKEREVRELEQRRKALEEKRKLEEQQRLAVKEKEEARQREAAAKIAANAQHSADLWNKTVDIEQSVMKTPLGKGNLNVTVDLQPEMSPQSYAITPKGGDKNMIISKNQDNYGMDQNSDDSTDDESAPRKPIPSWAEGANLKQLIIRQYFKPPDLDSFFGPIEPPRLESIFYKSKPRYFKRTSSAVWHSPPGAK